MRTVYVLRDAAGDPLYVGITKNMRSRIVSLRASRDWWDDVDSIEGHNVDDGSGPDVERTLIAALRPKYNRAGISTPYRAPNYNQIPWSGPRKIPMMFLRELFRLGLAGTFDASDDQAA